VEEDEIGQEAVGGGGGEEAEGATECRWKEFWYERKGSGTSLPLVFSVTHLNSSLQFQFNPEWFEDEDDDGTDDWDLNKYRKEKEAEDLAAEEARIAALQLS